MALVSIISVIGCAKPAASGQEPSSSGANGVAATINGEPISLSEFNERMGMKDNVQVVGKNGPTQVRVIGNFGLQAMQEQVDQAVLLQLAKDQNVLPTDADIDNEIKLQSKVRAGYVELLYAQGWTMPMIRRDLLVGLARERVIMKGITISPSQIDQYIKANPSRFTEPARAAVYIIQVSKPSVKAEVDRQLAAKKAFPAVAREYGEQAHVRETGGLYETDVISQMPAKIQAIVARLGAKQSSEWIKDGANFLKFYLDSKVPARSVAVTEDQREMVRRLLAMQQGEKKNDFAMMFYNKLKASKVVVQVPYLKDAWQRTWDQMNSPAATGVGASPTPRR